MLKALYIESSPVTVSTESIEVTRITGSSVFGVVGFDFYERDGTTLIMSLNTSQTLLTSTVEITTNFLARNGLVVVGGSTFGPVTVWYNQGGA